MVLLQNKRHSAFVGTLYHDRYCRLGGACGCKQEEFLSSVKNPASGEVGYRAERRQVPVGFSVPPMGQSGPYHRAIMRVPGVAEALREGWLVAIEAANPRAEERPAPAPKKASEKR